MEPGGAERIGAALPSSRLRLDSLGGSRRFHLIRIRCWPDMEVVVVETHQPGPLRDQQVLAGVKS